MSSFSSRRCTHHSPPSTLSCLQRHSYIYVMYAFIHVCTWHIRTQTQYKHKQHAHAHAHARARAHTHTHTHEHVHMYTKTYTRTHTSTNVRTFWNESRAALRSVEVQGAVEKIAFNKIFTRAARILLTWLSFRSLTCR